MRLVKCVLCECPRERPLPFFFFLFKSHSNPVSWGQIMVLESCDKKINRG